MVDLSSVLKKYERLAVAYSGGVDSSLALRCAADVLGTDNVMAFTLVSVLTPERERYGAGEWALSLGVRHEYLETDPLSMGEIAANGRRRCYYCKRYMFGEILRRARTYGFDRLADGSHAGDSAEYRPGEAAALELGVISPLKDAGLGKPEIREMAARLGLPQTDKPSGPCLATRVPYGVRLDGDTLRMIDKAEEAVLSLGIRSCRVRHHGSVARIEADPRDFGLILADQDLPKRLRDCGYSFVTLDLEGYRSGSYDEGIGE